jgi:TolA-binding protein
VDETQLYYDVVGGEKKKRVYGVGSYKSICYPGSSSDASSSVSRNAQLESQIQELQDKLKQMEERQEEANRLREEQTRNDVQRMFLEMMAQWQRSNPPPPYPHNYPPNNDGNNDGTNDS